METGKPDVVYIAAGLDIGKSPSDVLKSTDRGQTWERTHLDQKFYGNSGGSSGDHRVDGECIAVDPHNSNIVLCGTRKAGLYCSMDGAQTWSKVDAVPNAADPDGIRTVVFDPDSGVTSDGRTKVAYVGVNGQGIYTTTDGGNTWQHMPGSPLQPKRMAVSGGAIYVTSGVARKVVESTGVFRYRDGAWKEITPEKNHPYGALAVDPNNPDMVLCVAQEWASNRPIWLSMDGGETWRDTTKSKTTSYPYMEWRSGYFANIVSCIVIDPFDHKSVWYADGQGIWHTPDITASTVAWTTVGYGVEELCVTALASPPSGAPLFSTVLDNGGFRHTDLYQSPDSRVIGSWDSWYPANTAIDYCEQDPNYIVRLGDNASGNDSTDAKFVYSTDNGQSWTANDFPGNAGKVAVSCERKENESPIVVALPAKKTPIYSTDNGKTWTASTGVPEVILSDWWQYKRQVLAADKVDPLTFYLYDYANGQFYTSSDGGKSFEKKATLLKQAASHAVNSVRGKPGAEHEVWVSLYENGLYRSDDAGASFTKVPGVTEAVSFAFGKEAPDSDFPTVFVYGTVNGVSGIFRSTDDGTTWVRVNNDDNPIGAQTRNIEADRQVYGRVYVPTGGRGIMVGELLTDIAPQEFTCQEAALRPAGDSLSLRFSTPVDLDTVSAETISVSGKAVKAVISSNRVSDNHYLLLLFEQPLDKQKEQLILLPDSIRDIYGQALSGDRLIQVGLSARTILDDNETLSVGYQYGSGVSIYTQNPKNYGGEPAVYIGSGSGSSLNKEPAVLPGNTGQEATSENYVLYHVKENEQIEGFTVQAYVNAGFASPVEGSNVKNFSFFVSTDSITFTMLEDVSNTYIGTSPSESISHREFTGKELPDGIRYLKIVWPKYVDKLNEDGTVKNGAYPRYIALGDVTLQVRGLKQNVLSEFFIDGEKATALHEGEIYGQAFICTPKKTDMVVILAYYQDRRLLETAFVQGVTDAAGRLFQTPGIKIDSITDQSGVRMFFWTTSGGMMPIDAPAVLSVKG